MRRIPYCIRNGWRRQDMLSEAGHNHGCIWFLSNSFGKDVLVIEGDCLMRESKVRKGNQPGCTLVWP